MAGEANNVADGPASVSENASREVVASDGKLITKLTTTLPERMPAGYPSDCQLAKRGAEILFELHSRPSSRNSLAKHLTHL